MEFKIDASAEEISLQHSFEDEVFFRITKQRDNWAKVAIGSIIASILSGICMIAVLPLKDIEPFVVMVDKTTGQAEKIVQVRPATLQQQDAVLQAELSSYVIDRETYHVADNKTRIPDVMLRSSENAADTLSQTWRSESSDYPPTVYGNDVRVRIVMKNALFAGHDAGAENWAIIASLVETCKLNAVDPQAYLTATLTAIVNGHKQSRIEELLPWNYQAG